MDDVSSAQRRIDGRKREVPKLASWNRFPENVKHGSVSLGRMPAAATHASIRPSRSPIVFPIFHIPS